VALAQLRFLRQNLAQALDGRGFFVFFRSASSLDSYQQGI